MMNVFGLRHMLQFDKTISFRLKKLVRLQYKLVHLHGGKIKIYWIRNQVLKKETSKDSETAI